MNLRLTAAIVARIVPMGCTPKFGGRTHQNPWKSAIDLFGDSPTPFVFEGGRLSVVQEFDSILPRFGLPEIARADLVGLFVPICHGHQLLLSPNVSGRRQNSETTRSQRTEWEMLSIPIGLGPIDISIPLGGDSHCRFANKVTVTWLRTTNVNRT